MITMERISNAVRRELKALWNKVNDLQGEVAALKPDTASAAASDKIKDIPQNLLFDGHSGATRDNWNAALKLRWRRKGGDWRDAKRVPHGRYAYASFSVAGGAGTQEIRVGGLGPLVTRWLREGNTGLMLRPPSGDGTAVFSSREHDNPSQHPRLIVETDSGRYECRCTADVDMPRSTYKAQGTSKSLWVTSTRCAALQFDLAKVSGTVRDATLVLTTTKQYGMTHLDVMELMPPQIVTMPRGKVEQGLAAEVGSENKLDGHPDVVFAGDFTPAKRKAYSHYWVRGATYQNEPALGGTMSVRGEFNPDDNGSMSTRMRLTKYPGEGRAPTELYFRAYIYLEKDFLSETDGIKLLGSLAATWENLNYQKEEDWGGGKKWKEGVGSDPCTGYGWSMRFVTNRKPTDDNPYKELASLGVLAYWIGQKAYDGDYARMGDVCLQTERWYCIEQRVKLNTISNVDPQTRDGTPNPDGIFEVWVDGVKVYSKTDIRWRKTPDSVIQDAPWLNAYHGGRKKPKAKHHYRVGNVVVAKRYIGPMKSAGAQVLPVAAAAASSWLPEPGHMVKLPARNSFRDVDPCPRSNCSYNRGGGFNSDGNRYVVDAFSGGVFNPWYSRNGALVLHGGGHGDSGENSVYVFDLDTMQFARVSDPYDDVDKAAKKNFDRDHGEHPDGSPASAHTYDLLAVIPPDAGGGRQGALLRPISLAVLGPSLNVGWSHAYDFAAGEWRRYSKNKCPMRVSASGVQMSALDTQRKRVWYFIGNAAQACYVDLKKQEHVLAPSNRRGFGAKADTAMMVYVPERDLLIANGTVNGKQRIGWFNPAKPEEGWRYAELSQALPIDYTTAIGYSPDTRRLYYYSRSSKMDIYEIEIPVALEGKWNVTWRTILGDEAGALDWGGRNSGGLYKRWDYVPALKCFIFMPRARETGVYLYRPHTVTRA